ncbi:MAG: hypothetical protein HKP31_04905 [Nitrosopumilus sp.]|nr:hypothetical protein [Nitrosopumilus sp.]
MPSDESDDSITFRSYPLENDDHCKTLIKIEPDQMEKMGIDEGDIVRITGRDSTIAFCFSLSQKELEKTKSQDVPVEHLNSPHKKTDYPRMILSSLVSRNACPSRRMRLVRLEKLSGKSFKDSVPEATVVTLGTLEFAEKTMPNYKGNIDFSLLFGRLIKEKERISIPFLPDYARRIEKKASRGRPPHPVNFASLIINAKPEEHEFWLVTNNTKFEFQNVPMDEFGGKAPKSEALSLLKVIPIVKKLHLHDTDIMFASVEVFENTMKINWYTQQRIKLPDDIISNPSKFNNMNIRPDSPELTIEIKDDLGNVHSDGHSGGGGGSFPDPSANEIVSDYSGEYRFLSTLDPAAKEIAIIVKEIAWIKRELRQVHNTMTPPNMRSMYHSNDKLSILEGPWEFKIAL